MKRSPLHWLLLLFAGIVCAKACWILFAVARNEWLAPYIADQTVFFGLREKLGG